MLDERKNIDKYLLIQILHFFIEKESDSWFITNYETRDSFITIYTSEVTGKDHKLLTFLGMKNLSDYKISEITDDSFDVFSPEERLSIELLRIHSHFDSNKKKVVTKQQAVDNFSKTLKKGDRVWYNKMPAIITYKHKGDELKFTINVKDTYYKYVPASLLYPRIKKDLSNIEVPKKYQEMSTTQLLRLRTSYGFLPDVMN